METRRRKAAASTSNASASKTSVFNEPRPIPIKIATTKKTKIDKSPITVMVGELPISQRRKLSTVPKTEKAKKDFDGNKVVSFIRAPKVPPPRKRKVQPTEVCFPNKEDGEVSNAAESPQSSFAIEVEKPTFAIKIEKLPKLKSGVSREHVKPSVERIMVANIATEKLLVKCGPHLYKCVQCPGKTFKNEEECVQHKEYHQADEQLAFAEAELQRQLQNEELNVMEENLGEEDHLLADDSARQFMCVFKGCGRMSITGEAKMRKHYIQKHGMPENEEDLLSWQEEREAEQMREDARQASIVRSVGNSAGSDKPRAPPPEKPRSILLRTNQVPEPSSSSSVAFPVKKPIQWVRPEKSLVESSADGIDADKGDGPVKKRVRRVMKPYKQKFTATPSSIATEYQPEDDDIRCDTCGQEFMTQAGLDLHLSEEHLAESGIEKVRCLRCKYRPLLQGRYRSVIIHMYRHHYMDAEEAKAAAAECFKAAKEPKADPPPAEEDEVKVKEDANPLFNYPCADCEEGFEKRSEYNRHRREKHAPSEYKCGFCDAIYANRKSLRNHERYVHHAPLIKARKPAVPEIKCTKNHVHHDNCV